MKKKTKTKKIRGGSGALSDADIEALLAVAAKKPKEEGSRLVHYRPVMKNIAAQLGNAIPRELSYLDKLTLFW